MRLRQLTVQGMRGFRDRQTVSFGQVLTLVLGANGTGKTSLVEALEWLLYGRTARRERGEGLSKQEYKGSYANVHWDWHERPFVEAVVDAADGTEHTVRRELSKDESSDLYVDGEPRPDLSVLGVLSEFAKPLVMQHALQDFIHSQPKQRYRALSSMLGLEGLIRFRDDVDKLQGTAGYATSKPNRATEARAFLAHLLAEARTYAAAGRLVESLQQRPLSAQDASRVLRGLVVAAIGADLPDEAVPEALRDAQAARAREVVDWDAYRPHALTDPVLQMACPDSRSEADLAHQLVEYLQGAGDEVGRVLAEFYRMGLQLREGPDSDRCPFCHARTLTAERTAEIEAAADAATGGGQAQEAAATRLGELRKRLSAADPDSWPAVECPSDEAWERLTALLPPEAPLPQFRSAATALQRQRDECQKAYGQVTAALTHVEQRVAGLAPAEDVSNELPTRIEALASAVRAYVAALDTYRSAFNGLSPGVSETLSSQGEVRYLGFLLEAWERWSDVEIAAQDIALEESLGRFRAEVREFIEEKQKEMLATRGSEIKGWYDLLNPDELVAFSRIQPATDALQILAASYGEEMQAAPNLSASHLNCLGLAVHLGCAVGGHTPFRFVLIDDPVQSMDDHHAQRFIQGVLGKLLGDGHQVIVMTHLERVHDHIDARYRRAHNVYRLRFEAHHPEGPTITEAGPRLVELLQQAQKCSEATNESYRHEAVLSLRQFVERFVKDLFQVTTGQLIPRAYESESWPRLHSLLLRCPGFDVADEGPLEHAHKFTSSHLHEDDAAAARVPGPHEIRPHVESMQKLIAKYADQLGLDADEVQ